MSSSRGVIRATIFVIFYLLVVVHAEVEDTEWWKTALVYQIYPKSFKDSNNDGYGDIQGIISKLQHFKDTGVTAAWLSPIYKSPQVDDGYDISDFMDVDPIFGTLDDFDQLVANATELGIKIVMDLVPNHSSNEHPWFALSENRTEGYENYYVWADNNTDTGAEPNNWISVFKYSAWKWSEKREQFYLHQFTVEQPDLNYAEPAVVEAMNEVLTFWLDRGVAGFRIDAVPHIFETGLEDEPLSGDDVGSHEYGYLNHIYTKDQPKTYDLVYSWRKLIDDYSEKKGDYSRILMTESATDIEKLMLYYGDEETGELGAHFSFNFNLLGTYTNARDIVNTINYWNSYMPVSYTANWLTGNHDNSRVATRDGPENVDAFNMLIAMLPGVLITYNGEEIGQENGEVSYEQCKDPSACDEGEEYFYANSRDFARTPYQWDNSTNAGFNEGAEPWLPVSAKYLEKNLYLQSIDGVRSHYHNYQNLISLRQEEALVSGALNIKALSDKSLALTRKISGGNNYTLVMNIGNVSETVDLTAAFSSLTSDLQVVIASVTSSRNIGSFISPGAVELDAYEGLVLLQSENYVEDTDWWKTAVVYQIYPKSFKDSNNDGYGDIQGIISKLQHLKDAGVTAAWLSPIYKSPQVDDGYDISDFMEVDPLFGTLDDFDQLVAKATELGIKIVMDLVPNHSSNQHPWFLLSENRTEGYENFYVWADSNATTGKEPNNWLSVFKNSSWEWSSTRGQYYLHQFAKEQPDLNYAEGAVVNAMNDVINFWLDRGIAGFRIDAVPFIFETGLEDEPLSGYEPAASNEYRYLSHIYTMDQPETYELVYSWRKLVDDYSNQKGDFSRIIMTESGTYIDKVMLYYGNEETGEVGAHFSFNFFLLGSFTNAQDLVDAINYWNSYMPIAYTANWLTGNHDNSRVATRNGPQTVDGFNMLIAMLPGVLITYNGEEIGQENGEVSYEQCQDPNACDEDEEYFYANSRDFARTPYQWDNTTNAGFNDGAETWLPVSQKYLETNLYFESEDGVKSHYHVYQSLISLRQEEALVSGALNIQAMSDNVLALTRKIAGGNNYTLVFNIGNVSETVNLTAAFSSLTADLEVVIISVNSTKSIGSSVSPFSIELDAYESLVLLQSATSSSEPTTEATPSTESSTESTTTSTQSSSSSSTESSTSPSTVSSSSTTEGTGSASTIYGSVIVYTLVLFCHCVKYMNYFRM